MPPPNLTPLDLSDEDLDRLSEITEQDIVIANQFITRQLDPKFKNLLLAELALSPAEEALEIARQMKIQFDLEETQELEESNG